MEPVYLNREGSMSAMRLKYRTIDTALPTERQSASGNRAFHLGPSAPWRFQPPNLD